MKAISPVSSLETRAGGTPIFVRDVAAVTDRPMPREGAVSRDGRGEALAGKIIMLKGSNGREVVRRVEDRLASSDRCCRPASPSVRSTTRATSSTRPTHRLHRTLRRADCSSTLVLFVVPAQRPRVPHHGVGDSAVVVVCRPGHEEFGVSANLMSLGALDFGLLVDASIVMVENFVRRLEHAGPIAESERQSLFRARRLRSWEADCLWRRASSLPCTCRFSRSRDSRAGCSRRWRSRSA